jgi:hypothetical protein
LKRQGTISLSQSQPPVDARQVQFTKAGQLTISVAARDSLLAHVTRNNPDNDNGPANQEVMEVNDTSESETDQPEPTDYPDGDIFFDNQEHILDRPITKSDLDKAINPSIPYPGCCRDPNNQN